MGFLKEMQERGMMVQVTHEEELRQHLNEKPRTFYVGFDPTADGLHIGHLVPVMAMRLAQKHGHRVIVLIGGGTAMVGDPTGKTEMRQMAEIEVIDQRARKVAEELGTIINLRNSQLGIVLNNGDWLRQLEYLPFLRDIGAHFSVNRMLTAECFKQRLEKGLSFLEFNYMLLQSYDFYHLYKHHDCSLQMGGDDQWSNMLGGMELVRRKERGQAFCLTVPLLVNTQGKKMGKTESGAIWLNPEKTPAFELFQYFRNVEDELVEKLLFIFTDLPVPEVKRLGALRDKEINDAKITLAYEVTKLLRGQQDADEAMKAAKALFGGGGVDTANVPEVFVSADQFGSSMNVVDALVAAQIFPSKSEGRRFIQGGGLVINEQKVEDINQVISRDSVAQAPGLLVRKGKKHCYYLRIR